MNELEKAQLDKQKKLLDCLDQLKCALSAFERLEYYKAQVIPMMDGFDLTHGSTYLELTNHIKQELFYIKFFSSHTANQLADYNRLCHPNHHIESVKEKKKREKYGILSFRPFSPEVIKIKRVLQEPQQQLDGLLHNQEKRKLEEKKQFKDLDNLKHELDAAQNKKQKKQKETAEKIAKNEINILRLQWAVLIIFGLQIAIFIKTIL